MKIFLRTVRIVTPLLLVLGVWVGNSLAMIKAGTPAPLFREKDPNGKVYDLSSLKNKQMIVLYFFDVDSESSREMLLNLGELSRKFADADLTVWGISRSPKEKTTGFVTEKKPGFPILVDSSGIAKAYYATMILPVVCIVGPELKVMDYFQGGGKTTEVMLARLAERNLQRKKTTVAKAIAQEAVRTNPKNAMAKAVEGYAELKDGNVDKAEKVFDELASKQDTESEVLGKEGLAAVYLEKGEAEKAVKTAEEVQKKAPRRSFAHVVKAEVLYGRNKKEEAAEELKKAVEKTEAEPHQKALAYNQFGRFHASVGKFDQARRLYDQAVDIDPYFIEATSNKGMAYEKEGQWDKALQAYEKALSVDGNDAFSSVLAKNAAQMAAMQNDSSQKERVDRLVKELAERYRSQHSSWGKKAEDTWTSRPLIVSFVDFRETGGLSERDGFSTVVVTGLSDLLNTGGRVQVVERVLIERLMEELNLGSSDLADPETALWLGRVLAAKVLGTGTLFMLPGNTMLNLRLIDTETTAVAKVLSEQFSSSGSLESGLDSLNRKIADSLAQKYPLRGFVVQADGARIMINIGSRQGVAVGTKFEVLEEQRPIEYKGRMLSPAPKPIAVIETNAVEEDFSYATVVSRDKPFSADAKIQEKPNSGA